MIPDTNPAFGEQLLPKLVDNVASSDPDREYACIARDFDMSKGIIKVTMAQLAQAVDGVAHWIDANLHLPSPFSTIAYLGVPDIRYTFVVFAAVKCGHKALLLSPRNTAEINAELIDRAGGTYIVHSPELQPVAEGLVKVRPAFKPAVLGSLDECLATKSPHYPYDKRYEDAWQDPVAVLHSSGSTGKPKLVTINHGTLASSNADRWIPVPSGRKPQNSSLWDFEGGGRYYSCFPPFHLAGVAACITMPIRYGATIVMGPPTLPPSGALVKNLMDAIPMKAVYLPPIIAEQWIREPGAFDQAKKLDWFLFSGGPLATNIGNELCKHTIVTQIFGALETGQNQLLIPDPPSDWEWLAFNPEDDIEMREELNGAHELVIIQTEKSKPRRMLTYNFPDVKEWQTGDLFVRHPSKPGLWRFIGRKDDLLVLSSGHKFQPVSMESELLGHDLVTGALVVGLGRPQPALLLEVGPAGKDLPNEVLMDKIWPAIEIANSKVQEYGRIGHDKVAFIKDAFPRAGKGTVIRGMTTQKFAAHIADLYKDHTGSTVDVELFQKDPRQYIRDQVFRLVQRKIQDNDDFFAAGLDSLLTAELSRNLIAASTSGSTIVTLRDIYEHPSINSLTSFVTKAVKKDDIENNADGVQELVKKYTALLPTSTEPVTSSRDGDIRVAVIGSRGTLGSAIVRALLKRQNVSQVICLDRKKPGTFPSSDDRTAHLQIDLSQPKLGLDDQALNILASASTIVHNAWRVDFNLSLASFESEFINSVVETIRISKSLPNRTRVAFVSSIAATARWPVSDGPVQEAVISNTAISAQRGYGYSKLASEIILDAAANRSEVPVTIFRCGQIAGPTQPDLGEWSRREAVFALTQASKTMGLIPHDLAPVDWIPSDDLANIISELVTQESASLSVYNLLHPKPVPWQLFVSAVQDKCPDIKPVTSIEWLQSLEKLALTESANSDVSAVKLLDYFRDLTQRAPESPTYSTERAHTNSVTFKDLKAIDEKMIETWLTQWGF